MTEQTNIQVPHPLRILFVSDHLGHDGGRIHGATRYFLDVLPRLHQVKQLTLHVAFLREYHPAAKTLHQQGIFPVFLSRSKLDPRAIWDLVSLIRKHKIQLLHCAGMKGILCGRIAAKITGVYCIDHFHDMIPPSRGIRYLLRRTRKYSAQSVAISQAVAAFIEETFNISANRITCIHNGVRVEDFANVKSPSDIEALRKEFGIPAQSVVLTCLGRLHPQKGQRDAIAALQGLHDATIWLLLVGDGPDRSHLEKLAKDMQVIIAGQRDDIPQLLSITSIMLVPSTSEGLGLAAMEALAAGVPVIAYDVGGLSEMVKHGENGLLVPTGNIDELRKSIRYVLDNPSVYRKLSDTAQHKAQTYSLDRHVTQLVTLYDKICFQAENDARNRMNRDATK